MKNSLTSRQDPDALVHGLSGLGFEHRVVIVADGVGDDGEGKARHAGGAGHGFGGVDEAVGHDGGGGDAGFVSGNGVMQTA